MPIRLLPLSRLSKLSFPHLWLIKLFRPEKVISRWSTHEWIDWFLTPKLLQKAPQKPNWSKIVKQAKAAKGNENVKKKVKLTEDDLKIWKEFREKRKQKKMKLTEQTKKAEEDKPKPKKPKKPKPPPKPSIHDELLAFFRAYRSTIKYANSEPDFFHIRPSSSKRRSSSAPRLSYEKQTPPEGFRARIKDVCKKKKVLQKPLAVQRQLEICARRRWVDPRINDPPHWYDETYRGQVHPQFWNVHFQQ